MLESEGRETEGERERETEGERGKEKRRERERKRNGGREWREKKVLTASFVDQCLIIV